MFKTLLITALTSITLFANSLFVGMSIETLKKFEFQDQFEKPAVIPNQTKTVLISHEKGTGAMVNEYLAEQGSDYLNKHHAVFIADISRMPSLITSMFALPKMKKYPHTIFLNYSDSFEKAFPSKEEQITVLHFNEGMFLSKIEYISNSDELKKVIEE